VPTPPVAGWCRHRTATSAPSSARPRTSSCFRSSSSGPTPALAVIFAAKGLVRREDIEKNTLYYLAGTMTNVTYSVVVGIAVRVLIGLLGLGQLTF